MEMRNPEEVFLERIEFFDASLVGIKKIELVLSLLKLIFAGGGVFFLFRVVLRFSPADLYIFLGFLAALVITAVVHEGTIKKREFHLAQRTINQEEIEAVHGAFLDYANGEEFVNPDHPYIEDLNIFGRRSVFHYINRTTTSLGKKKLSDWLKAFPGENTIEEVSNRQAAVKELGDKIDLRQKIQAHAKGIKDSRDKLESVRLLFGESDFVRGKLFLIIFIHVFPIVTFSAIVLVFFHFSWLIPAGCAFIQAAVNRIFRKKILRLYALTSQNSKVLSLYSRIISEIERESFQCPSLKEMQSHFFIKNSPASLFIKKLSSRFQFFEARSSKEIHFLMNNVFFWDLHCVLSIEKWKHDVKKEIEKWFDVIGRFEALSSLGNLRFSHPDWVMPVLRNDGFVLDAQAMGHPLIPEAERIHNSITLEGDCSIVIVTGPNMAGKTTFLKTSGVNIVLALAGSPVCAAAFDISPVSVYTSMKVNDSLDKGMSLFYAELQRLKLVLDAVQGEKPSFFLIDEMLKGTNELDRHSGAEALIRQLVAGRARGMVATHDLKLTTLEREFPGKIWNFYFDGIVEDDRLIFDYLLKKGICTSSNALELMKKIGIRLD